MYCTVCTTDFSAKWSKFRLFLPYLVKSCAWFTSPRGDLPLPTRIWAMTYLPTLSVGYLKHVWGPLKSQQGSPRQAIQGQNQLPIQKTWLGLGLCPMTQVWPFLLQILDKKRPKSSQNLTPVLWLVLTTTHYQEQLLQNQGEFMVKKGPLESEKGPRGPEKGLLRS